jgi:signal peptidase I
MLEELHPDNPDISVLFDEKLIRRACWRALLFLAMMIFFVIMTIFLAQEPLYMFNVLEPDPNLPLSGQVFRSVMSGLIILSFAYLTYFSIRVIRIRFSRKDLSVINWKKLERQYSWFDLLLVIPAFLAVVVVLNGFLFGFAIVHGESMEPTFVEGDRVVIYHFQPDYETEDIVILDRGEKLIKRLIATEGDYLQVDNTGVHVNGVLVEPDIQPGLLPYDGIIPSGYCFVLGDNRDHSNDSRYFGLVSTENLLGKVIYPIKG